ncbi:acyl-CoA dehydrogenase family protein [Campylobacter hyointestinalis]|uniref:acyl-CoA dehydrogenase family protein n=1 Tax=Campylobacter hyointestinalis TaxID=198 RepID=UPI000CE320B6|nr:acyl-CoA dehydrogenase family protein [Campylobacter hyointestinalis]PPB55662.1 acyl-CoA dehydrogenase [Campylobacter hyointestinalis subsp. hyointestinalis]
MALQKLANLAPRIDAEGIYAKDCLNELGTSGYFSVLDQRNDLFKAILNISKVAEVCGTTGFCMWCQFAIIWYLLNSDNENLKNELLPKLKKAEILGGTALSNPMKAFAGIEKNQLKATRVSGGYIINGTLAWVSNIEQGSVFGAIALDENEPIMGVIRCDERVKLAEHIKYSTLEGSATKSVTLKEYFLPDSDILTNDIYSYLIKITPGFILLQAGIAAGIINASLEVIERSNKTHSHINAYLPFSYDSLKIELDELLKRVENTAFNINLVSSLEILQLRLDASLLTQKATNAAVLFSGTKGYFKNAKAARVQREGNFVLIVTPSIKHLLKEIDDIKKGSGCVTKWKHKVAS